MNDHLTRRLHACVRIDGTAIRGHEIVNISSIDYVLGSLASQRKEDFLI